MNIYCSFFCSSSCNKNCTNKKIENYHLTLTIIGVQLTLNKIFFLLDNKIGTFFFLNLLRGEAEVQNKV